MNHIIPASTWRRALILGFATAAAMATPAATQVGRRLTATPATLRAVLQAATGGETIVLAPGQYGDFTLPYEGFSPGIRIDATQARFTALTLRKTFGVDVRGGTVDGPREQTFAVLIDSAKDIRVAGMLVSGARIGVTVMRSDDVEVVDNRFDGVRSDGVNVALSHRVLIQGNTCRNFDPIPPVYAPDGKLVRDGDHPDCIQGWSRSEAAPTGDITIIGNTAYGLMQGIFFNKQVLEGVDTGGYDRFVIKDNDLTLGYWHGITLEGVRGARVTGNKIRAVPGARHLAYPYQLIKPWLKVTGTNVVQCGNQVADDPDGPGTDAC